MTRQRNQPIDPDTPVVRFVGKFCTSCAKAGIVLQLTNINRVQGSGNLTCKPCAATEQRRRHAIRTAQKADPNYVAPVRAKREPQAPADPIRAHLHKLLDSALNKPCARADKDFDDYFLTQRIRSLMPSDLFNQS